MERILKNWTFIRWIRLLMGLLIIIQSILITDLFFGIAGLIFFLMALFNQGCCNLGNSCANQTRKESKIKEIDYEEVV